MIHNVIVQTFENISKQERWTNILWTLLEVILKTFPCQRCFSII